MRKAARDGNGVADGAEDLVATASSGSGSALPGALMRKFESSLGADLSSVRVHTGGASADAASAVGAKAYTIGQDIHFGAGHYDPSSNDGQQLLAHEVAHTVQQSGGTPTRQNKLEVSTPGDHLEAEADRAATAMVSGQSFAVTSGSGFQRKVFRDADGFSGPSYARKGPPGSTVDDRRQATQVPMGSAAYAEEYDNTCLDAAKKLVAGVQTLYGVATAIEKRAKGPWYKPTDTDLMELAKQLRDTAKALQGMKQGWDKLKEKKFDFSKSKLVDEPDLPKVLDVLKASKDSILQAFETTEALSNFQSDPSRETAKVWADNVAQQFNAAKSIIGALPFPPGCGFMKQYFEGLLGAPSVYISAFQAIASQRYNALDKEAGISNSESHLNEGGNISWEGGGDVQYMVQMSFSAPNGGELYNWFKNHKKIQGVNMEKMGGKADVAQRNFKKAKALFVMELARDSSVEQFRDGWVAWINAFEGTAQPTALATDPAPPEQEAAAASPEEDEDSPEEVAAIGPQEAGAALESQDGGDSSSDYDA